MTKTNKKGFTLIELLAVIIIMAIIALITVPLILNIIDKSKRESFEQTVNRIIKASEMYYAEDLMNNSNPDVKTFDAP